MYDYKAVYESIQSKVDSYELSYSEACLLNDAAYEKYMTEVSSETLQKIENGAKKAIVVGDKLGHGYNKIMDKGGHVVAKAIVKKPNESAAKENPHVMEDYVDKLNKIKTTFKVGATTLLIAAPGTAAWMVPLTISAFKNSDNPAEREKAEWCIKKINPLISKLKAKWNDIKEKVDKANKTKEITQSDKSEFDKAYADGLNIAKEIDRVTKASISNKQTPVTESAIILSDILFDEDGMTKESAYDSLIDFIMNTDYDELTYEMVNGYIDLL